MEPITLRDVRAVFYYGVSRPQDAPAAETGAEKLSVQDKDIHGVVAALEKWNRISDDTRTTYKQVTQCGTRQPALCGTAENREQLRTLVTRDLHAWAKKIIPGN